MPIKRLDDGAWDINVCVNRQRLHRRLPPTASKSDAKALEAELRSALGKKLPNIPGDPPLPTLMAAYMRHADTLRHPRPAKYAALRIGRWVQGKTASKARQVAAAFVQDMTGHYEPGTINKSLNALRKALSLAYERGLTPMNYGDHVKTLSENNIRTVTLTMEQVQRLADCASPAMRAAIWIAVYTGCRRGEIIGMRPEHVGGHSITLTAGMTKSKRDRVIPIVAPLRPWLEHLPIPLKTKSYTGCFDNARKAAGMPGVTFHDLRRTTATLLLAHGTPLHVISKLLGHSSVSITAQRYAHLQVDEIRDALDGLFGTA